MTNTGTAQYIGMTSGLLTSGLRQNGWSPRWRWRVNPSLFNILASVRYGTGLIAGTRSEAHGQSIEGHELRPLPFAAVFPLVARLSQNLAKRTFVLGHFQEAANGVTNVGSGFFGRLAAA